ncbi:MAG: Ca-activated chloride channel family protein [Rhodothermales bacterium]|jgi:Ca-activated chloride channel family protein
MNMHTPNALLHVFWLLPLIIILIGLGWQRRRRLLRGFVSDPELSAELTSNVSVGKRRWRETLLLLGLLMWLLAYAGPHWGTHLVKRPIQSRDIMVVLDTSRSMLATDVTPYRLRHAKWFLRQLVSRTPGDRYGLIAFAGDAFLECPLTQDRNGFMLFLDDIDTDTIPIGGTNLEVALEEALDAFAAAESSHRAVLLITDGDELDGKFENVLEEFREQKTPVFVLGIGNPEGEYIRLPSGEFVEYEGEKVKSRLNEAGLRKIADATEGIYLRSTVQKDGLDHMVQRVRRLVPSSEGEDTVSRPIERYQLPLFVALFCLLKRLGTGERRRQAIAKD